MNYAEKIITKSRADQDQEWCESIAWMADPDNSIALVRLAIASVATDPMDVARLMLSDERYAEIVQRMVCLVIVETQLRRMDRVEV